MELKEGIDKKDGTILIIILIGLVIFGGLAAYSYWLETELNECRIELSDPFNGFDGKLLNSGSLNFTFGGENDGNST